MQIKRHGKMDWFKIGTEILQCCILSLCLIYLQSTSGKIPRLNLKAGIKITRRNINNLRYADDTTLMEEREEELKKLLMRVKEESEKMT